MRQRLVEPVALLLFMLEYPEACMCMYVCIHLACVRMCVCGGYRTVAEESRAEAVWSAPWCLVVVDDTPECRLEYANQRALQLLRLSSFDDIYDYTLYDFIGGDDKSLQEW